MGSHSSFHSRTFLAAAALLAVGCSTGNYDEYGRRRPVDRGDAGVLAATSSPTEASAQHVGGSAGADDNAPAPLRGAYKVERAFPTGERRTSAVLLEKEMPREIILGAETEYRIRVENLTDTHLETVQVTDTIPASFEISETEPAGQVAGEYARWDLGTIAPRASKTLVIRGRAMEAGTIETCATVDYESKLCAAADVVAPSLGIAVETPAEGLSCDSLPLKVTVSNSGSGDARDVRVVHELPDGLLTKSGQRRVEMRFGDLSTLQAKEKTIQLEATRAGTFVHEVTARSRGGLESTAEPVTTVLREPRLDVTLTQTERVIAGRPVDVVAVVSNTGNGLSEDTSLRLKLSRAFDVVEFTGDGATIGDRIEWNLGNLEPGDSQEVNLRFIGRENGSYVGEAKATGRCAAEVTATARTNVRGLPALLLEVVDESDLILVGDEVTYDIRVENQGTAPDTNIEITAEVEEGIEIVSTSTGVPATISGSSVRFESVPTLGPGESIEYQVTVRSSREADSRFTVSLTSTQKQRPVVEAEATNFYR